jgi:hypothetical protein
VKKEILRPHQSKAQLDRHDPLTGQNFTGTLVTGLSVLQGLGKGVLSVSNVFTSHPHHMAGCWPPYVRFFSRAVVFQQGASHRPVSSYCSMAPSVSGCLYDGLGSWNRPKAAEQPPPAKSNAGNCDWAMARPTLARLKSRWWVIFRHRPWRALSHSLQFRLHPSPPRCHRPSHPHLSVDVTRRRRRRYEVSCVGL